MHSTCQHILPLLQLYVDHELAEMEAQEVEEHIELCSSCAEVLADEFLLRQTLKKGLDEDCAAPPELKENLQAWLSLQAVREEEAVNDLESIASEPLEGARLEVSHELQAEHGHSMPVRGLAIGAFMVAAAALLLFVLPNSKTSNHHSLPNSIDLIQPTGLPQGLVDRGIPGPPRKKLGNRVDKYQMRMNLGKQSVRSTTKNGLRPYVSNKKHRPLVPVKLGRKRQAFRPTLLHHDSARPRLNVVREWKPAKAAVQLVNFPISH